MPRLAGKANIYVGTTVVPYYLAKPANANDSDVPDVVLGGRGAPPAALVPDQTSRFITRFNPVPVEPRHHDDPAAGDRAERDGQCRGRRLHQAGRRLAGGDRAARPRRQPHAGARRWPTTFADACFVVAAIDLPLHGITNTTNPLYQAANERTFNVDLQNNTTGASVPDGKIDASGAHFDLPTLLSSPLTGRDNLRQGRGGHDRG